MKTILTSITVTVLFCVTLSIGYLLPLWGFARVVSPNNGEAEVIIFNDTVVGAANVGQQFTDIKYFWGRPSAVDYNGGGSGGSNKGASNPDYLKEVDVRVEKFLESHPYLDREEIPSELVTASASGLDPHISPLAAKVQIRRVAHARNIDQEHIVEIVTNMTREPLVGVPYINILELNVALDREVASN